MMVVGKPGEACPRQASQRSILDYCTYLNGIDPCGRPRWGSARCPTSFRAYLAALCTHRLTCRVLPSLLNM
jgi:hypothetical protein